MLCALLSIIFIFWLRKSALGLVWFPDGGKEHILHSLVGRQKRKVRVCSLYQQSNLYL